jgi:hypothetical protein
MTFVSIAGTVNIHLGGVNTTAHVAKPGGPFEERMMVAGSLINRNMVAEMDSERQENEGRPPGTSGTARTPRFSEEVQQKGKDWGEDQKEWTLSGHVNGR